jgi:DNA-binding PadR family transcriptional regulator
MLEPEINKYLPLTEATYYILLALVEPLHGYGVMQKVQSLSEGTVLLGPGTLYGAFNTLEKQGIITMVKAEERRKSYALTGKGRQVLEEQVKRLDVMARVGRKILPKLVKDEEK